MTTELLGRQMEQQQADGYRPRPESPLAQPIRESAMRVARRAIGPDAVRWLEALLRLTLGYDPGDPLTEAIEPLSLDRELRGAIAAMDALPVQELEQLAVRYSL